jgi:hypothetical protein
VFKQFPETYSVIFSNNTQWLYVLFSNISIQLHILHYICIPLTLTQCNLTTWNYLSQLRVETFGIALLLRIADRLKCTVQKVIKTNSVPFTCIIIQTNSEPLSCAYGQGYRSEFTRWLSRINTYATFCSITRPPS